MVGNIEKQHGRQHGISQEWYLSMFFHVLFQTQIQWCPSAAWPETKWAFGWDGRSRCSIPTSGDIAAARGVFLPVGKKFSFPGLFVLVSGRLNMIAALACDSQCDALIWVHHAVTRRRIQPNAALKHWVHCLHAAMASVHYVFVEKIVTLHWSLNREKKYLASFSNHRGNVFAHLTESLSTMADEIVFTFQCLGICWCVRARPAVSDLQSLWVLAVRSEEMSVVVFAGTCVHAKRACFCACAWQRECEKAWKWDSELKRLMSKNSVCSLSANCQPSITNPTHGLCKKRLESWVCVCVCVWVSMCVRVFGCMPLCKQPHYTEAWLCDTGLLSV